MGENYNKEDQGEFFPEFKASEDKRFAYFKKDFAIGRNTILSVSWKSLIFFFIALIMLIALFFSMGVEKGRRLAAKNTRASEPMIHSAKAQTNESRPANKVKTAPAEIASSANEKIARPYTIQIMALKKGEDTQKEVARLSAAGYEAFVISSGAWHQICIGRYAAQEDAYKNMRSIKQKYPDSYIRKISN